MGREKVRAAIYSMAAFYMLYTALQIFNERATWDAGKETLMFGAIAFFVIAAIGLIIFAIKLAMLVTKKEKEEHESETAGKGMD